MRWLKKLAFVLGIALQFSAVFSAFAGPYEIAMNTDGRSGGSDWIVGFVVAGAVVYGLFFATAKIRIILGLGVVTPVLLMQMTGNPLWLFSIYILPFVVGAVLDKFEGRDGQGESQNHD